MALSFESILENVLATAIATAMLAAFAWVVKRPFPQHLLKNDALYTQITVCIAGTLVFGVIAYLQSWLATTLSGFAIILFVSFYLLRRQRRFHVIGITDASQTVASGIDYKQSLDLARKSFAFLGVAASKLTRLQEFEKMVRRCATPATPVRLLLCRRNDPHLVSAANQELLPLDVKTQAYTDSLTRIAALRRKGYNICVRFYDSESELAHPLFRLLFIDGKTVLVSYRAWGAGDGSLLPQLVVRSPDGLANAAGFYYPFHIYFEALWEASKVGEWDFKL